MTPKRDPREQLNAAFTAISQSYLGLIALTAIAGISGLLIAALT